MLKANRTICSAMLMSIFLIGTQLAYADETSKKDDDKKEVKTSLARKQSLQEFAFSVGLADGRKGRWFDIRRKMAGLKGELDQIYQVGHLYLDNGDLQPPVILTGENLYQNHKSGRATDQSQIRYEILSPARFVSSHLDWYTYIVSDEDLLVSRPADEPFFKPRNKEEEDSMRKYYQNGFTEGANQVDMEAIARVKTLTTMIDGMYDYHILREKNMIEPPEISKVYVPISGNETKISLSNNLREVVGDAQFNLSPNSYKAYIDQQNPWETLPKAQIIP